MTSSKEPWFAVKSLFSHGKRTDDSENLFEERITLWRASTYEEVFAFAEAEASRYASSSSNCVFVRATDSFHLFEDTIGAGSEVWSVMRASHMDSELYIQTFCATPRDRSSDPDESIPNHRHA